MRSISAVETVPDAGFDFSGEGAAKQAEAQFIATMHSTVLTSGLFGRREIICFLQSHHYRLSGSFYRNSEAASRIPEFLFSCYAILVAC